MRVRQNHFDSSTVKVPPTITRDPSASKKSTPVPFRPIPVFVRHSLITLPSAAYRRIVLSMPDVARAVSDRFFRCCCVHPEETTEPNKAMQRTPTLVTRRKILVFVCLFMVEKVFRYSVGVPDLCR